MKRYRVVTDGAHLNTYTTKKAADEYVKDLSIHSPTLDCWVESREHRCLEDEWAKCK